MYKLYYLEIISNYLIPTSTQYEQPCRRNGNHAPIVLKTVVDSIPSSVQSNSIKLIFDAFENPISNCDIEMWTATAIKVNSCVQLYHGENKVLFRTTTSNKRDLFYYHQ
jgi:hypothetical protein